MPQAPQISLIPIVHVNPDIDQPLIFQKFYKKILIWKVKILSLIIAELHVWSILKKWHPSNAPAIHSKSTLVFKKFHKKRLIQKVEMFSLISERHSKNIREKFNSSNARGTQPKSTHELKKYVKRHSSPYETHPASTPKVSKFILKRQELE